MAQHIVIATIRPWNLDRYRTWKPPAGFKKHLISSPKNLTVARLKKLNPRYIFLPHWSWFIPPEIYEQFECVVFHETDLPYGRGGSPIQNLLVRGIYKTKISALRVVKVLDAGPIYMKRPLDMSRGSAHEIFQRISKTVFLMIDEIIKKNPRPKIQRGKAVVFKRRKPEESRIPAGLSMRRLYDFIRMLDVPEYPHAFIDDGDYRIEFFNADVRNDSVVADVLFKRNEHGKE